MFKVLLWVLDEGNNRGFQSKTASNSSKSRFDKWLKDFPSLFVSLLDLFCVIHYTVHDNMRSLHLVNYHHIKRIETEDLQQFEVLHQNFSLICLRLRCFGDLSYEIKEVHYKWVAMLELAKFNEFGISKDSI
jgi:hypothetical protein